MMDSSARRSPYSFMYILAHHQLADKLIPLQNLGFDHLDQLYHFYATGHFMRLVRRMNIETDESAK